MVEENGDVPLVMEEASGDEASQEESFDITVIAVSEISELGDIIEESIDIIDIPGTVEVNEPESCNVEVICGH